MKRKVCFPQCFVSIVTIISRKGKANLCTGAQVQWMLGKESELCFCIAFPTLILVLLPFLLLTQQSLSRPCSPHLPSCAHPPSPHLRFSRLYLGSLNAIFRNEGIGILSWEGKAFCKLYCVQVSKTCPFVL